MYASFRFRAVLISLILRSPTKDRNVFISVRTSPGYGQVAGNRSTRAFGVLLEHHVNSERDTCRCQLAALCMTGSACSCAAAAIVQAARTKAATAGERASWGQASASVESGRSLTGR